jgi:serine/threonine protein phosphatase PrpC
MRCVLHAFGFRKQSFFLTPHEGKKRHVRGGSSQDAYTAVWDLFSQFRPEGQNAGDSSPQYQQNEQRRFHVFGVFDGHRSDHAARYTAKAIGPIVAQFLRQPGVLQPLPGTGDGGAEADLEAEQREEHAVRIALTAAVEEVDQQISSRRWVSVVRDNSKNFYPMYEREVPVDFDLAAWDARHIETAWRMQFAELVRQEAASRGVPEHGLQAEVIAQQGKWFCRKQELFPGAALVMVLIDDDRKMVYCANAGDSRCVLATRPAKMPAASGSSVSSSCNPSSAGAADDKAGAGATRLSAVADSKDAVVSVALSQDHKPSDIGELQRVCSTPQVTNQDAGWLADWLAC